MEEGLELSWGVAHLGRPPMSPPCLAVGQIWDKKSRIPPALIAAASQSNGDDELDAQVHLGRDSVRDSFPCNGNTLSVSVVLLTDTATSPFLTPAPFLPP